MNLEKKATAREQWLALLVVLGLVAVFFRTIYFPGRETKLKISEQIKTVRMEKEALQKFTEALRTALEKKRAGETEAHPNPKLKVLAGEISPLATTTASLLANITSPRFTMGISIKKMSDLPPITGNGYTKSPFFLNLQGSFREMIRYLSQLEEVPALFRMDNVSMKIIDPKAARVDVELSGTLFKITGGNIARP